MREVIKRKDCVGRKLAELVVVFICMLASLLGIGLFSNNNAYADDSISLNVSTSNIALDLYSNSASGTFAESSSATITASTTSSSGYTLSIASSTGSTDLTNTTDNTSKITSISSNLTASDFSNSSNTQYNNKWGYKPSQYVTTSGDIHTTHTNTGANAVFKPLPNGAGEILAITDSANATGASDTYTMSIGARVTSDTTQGSYISGTFVIMAVANINQIKCDNTKLCVKYDGNGLTFSQTATQDARMINNVNYNSSTAQQQITKYSHTPNINDAGVQNGNYPDDANINDVVTIPGASSLHITLTYGGESGYDWMSMWQGNHSDYTAENDYSSGIQSCGTATSNNGMFDSDNIVSNVECDISGDAVTFGFHSDSGYATNGYGYYAVVTGTGIVQDRTLTSGEYATPTGTNAVFNGWSSTATTPGAGHPSSVEYADEADVKSNMPGNNTETKTLYAVWQQGYSITFTKDSNVSSIAVVDESGTTVGTITSSGQSLNLLGGNTYTFKPTYTTGYTMNTTTKTTGAGTVTPKLPNANFIVGAGSATISVTSRQMLSIQNYSCSNLANVGDTDMVYDTRDNTSYKIGKLADNKCWMLDNLAIDLTNDTILNGLTADNTDIDTTNDPGALAALKGTTLGTISDKYATAKVANWTSSYSYSAPLVNLVDKDVMPTSYDGADDPLKDQILAGNWKVGGYYNYCAATAGSYCYGDGTDYGTSRGDATSSICPKGWRLPTGSTNGEFSALANAVYGSFGNTHDATAVANYRNVLSLPLSGFFYNGSPYYQGGSGNFWSSKRANNYRMYHAYVTASEINPAYDSYTSNGRDYGSSVRCVMSSS